jgi:hypothetical protein
MITLEIKTLDLNGFKAAMGTASESMRRAAAATLNDVMRTSQSLMAKQVSATYRITQAEVKGSFRERRASANDLNASVESRGTKFPLFKWGVTGSRKDQRVQIEEVRGQRKSLQHGFLVITKLGRPQIYERVGAGRYPLKLLMGGAVPQMIYATRNWKVIEPQLSATFEKRLAANTNYFLNIKK